MTIQIFGVMKLILLFINQGCIKLIKNDNKDINNVKKKLYFK